MSTVSPLFRLFIVEVDPTSPKLIPLTPTVAEMKADSQLKQGVGALQLEKQQSQF